MGGSRGGGGGRGSGPPGKSQVAIGFLIKTRELQWLFSSAELNTLIDFSRGIMRNISVKLF